MTRAWLKMLAWMFAFWRRPDPAPQPATKRPFRDMPEGKPPLSREPRHIDDFSAIKARQAHAAEARARGDAVRRGWQAWLDAAVRQLLTHWPGMTYDEAKRTIIDHMGGIEYPDPAFDWSFDAAREVADEIAREYGESHGANE